MKHANIKIGGIYQAKVNRRLGKVRVDNIVEVDGYTKSDNFQGTTVAYRYWVTNLNTSHKVVFLSCAKFREILKG